MNIFLYGTLLNDEIRQLVFSETLQDTRVAHATVDNFATFEYPGECFPILLPNENSVTHGILLFDLCPKALARMSFYEGDEFDLATINARMENGEQVNAYYNKAVYIDCSQADQRWCYETWEEEHSAVYIRQTEQFMQSLQSDLSVSSASDVWQKLK